VGAPEGSGYAGSGNDPTGKAVTFTATADQTADEKKSEDKSKKDDKEDDMDYVSRITYPNIAYGADQGGMTAGTYLIRNATVWTNEDAGVLENTDVLIANGKIAGVGKSLSDRGATVIDGTDMHVTCGVIDEHSHIALSSVNHRWPVCRHQTPLGQNRRGDEVRGCRRVHQVCAG